MGSIPIRFRQTRGVVLHALRSSRRASPCEGERSESGDLLVKSF